MLYRLNEADIEVPEGWMDRTIHTFLLPSGPQGGALSFVVTRDYDSPGADLATYADKQLIEASQKLPSYKYISRKGVMISGQPATQADYTWRSPEGITVFQRQAVVKAGPVFLIMTLSSMQQEMQRIEPLWANMMQKIKLLKAEAPARA